MSQLDTMDTARLERLRRESEARAQAAHAQLADAVEERAINRHLAYKCAEILRHRAERAESGGVW